MDDAERRAAQDRCAAEGPLHDYLRESPQTQAEFRRLYLGDFTPQDLDRPSQLTEEMLNRKGPVYFHECGMTPERSDALRRRAEQRFTERRRQVPIIGKDGL